MVTSAEMQPRIAVVTGPWSRSNVSIFIAASRLLNILEPLSSEITWVATNCSGDENKLPPKVTLIRLNQEGLDRESFFERLFYHLALQIKIVLRLRKLRKVDVVIFAYAGVLLLFPFLYSALFLRKKTIIRIEGRSSVMLREKSITERHKIVRVVKIGIQSLIEKITYSLAHRILVEYEHMVECFHLQKYQHKVSLGNQYVDVALFRKTRELPQRTYQIGYFGHLFADKGVLELAQSLPRIIKNEQNLAIIAGEGNLKEQIRQILASNNIQGKVKLINWIDNNEMPDYLNDVKIVVVPSYHEGLPNIILEAMACGTVVLATPVGGVPDVIRDGRTGFIMDDNSPECIAQNILRVVKHPSLDEITRNARCLVENIYAYEVTMAKYKKVLRNL